MPPLLAAVLLVEKDFVCNSVNDALDRPEQKK
nr:MAG TPA: hypothetical protein [Inoviridae sp.]